MKSLNPNKAKIHRNYTVEEVAELFSVHKNTVRGWIKSGLPVCDDRKPMLILGADLRLFIRDKKAKRKQKCKPWELFCVRCRKPQTPAGGMVEYEAQTATKGRLIALCPDCSGVMNKFSSMNAIEALKPKLEVTLPRALNNINKIDNPLLNSDFNN